MSSTQRRRRYPSKSSSPKKENVPSQDCQKIQKLLKNFPDPCPNLDVIQCVGEGTFSKVYLVKDQEKKVAVKHLVPTASPDRILMEVECLKIAEGKHNVLQLLFVHRHLGDVIIAMPYIDCCKFSDAVRTMDHVEVRAYMRNLFMALAHIHKIGIIHRDIKPANFLYDRKKKIFKLVDFGLAQRTGETTENKEPQSRHPQCKRKLTSSDLANSMESPPPCGPSDKKRRINHPSGERGTCRNVLTEKTVDDQNIEHLLPNPATPPTKTNEKPDEEYYDKRGAILSARKRTRSSNRQQRPKLSDDLDPGDSDQEVIVCTNANVPPRTPNKNVESLRATPEVRRSPRKHPSSVPTSKTGFSKITISGSTIVSDKSSALKRQGSFTILDPASGVPSEGTPRLQASLTSRHSALMLPGGTNFLQMSMSSTANLQNQASFLMSASQSLSMNTKESPMAMTAIRGRFATPKDTQKKTNCDCFGRPQVCSKCLTRRPQRAARAGTPGFRPPEVLLKFEHQTTSVDLWAAGVILLCILSRTYPFFRAPDDYTALAELVALFGTKAVQHAAGQYGKRLICSENASPLDLQSLCQKLAERRHQSEEVSSSLCLATDQAIDLLSKVLALSSHERWTAEDALKHPFFED